MWTALSLRRASPERLRPRSPEHNARSRADVTLSPVVEPARGAGETVLVVEDDELARGSSHAAEQHCADREREPQPLHFPIYRECNRSPRAARPRPLYLLSKPYAQSGSLLNRHMCVHGEAALNPRYRGVLTSRYSIVPRRDRALPRS